MITLKGILTLGGLVLCILNSQGQQYVTIPDAGFRNKLKSIYSLCFNANDELDITRPEIKTATSIDFRGCNIYNIEGIQYFEELAYLNISYNFVSELPAILPPKLKTLILKDNQLRELPKSLDVSSLYLIDISQNFFCSIPTKLPYYANTEENFCLDFAYQAECGNNNVKFNATTPQKPDYSYSWDFGDPTSYPKNTSTEDNPIHLYTDNKIQFNVKLTLKNNVRRTNDDIPVPNTVTKTIEIIKNISLSNLPQLAMESNVSLCSASTLLNAGSGFKSYLWQDGSTAQTLEVKKSGTYTVMVTNEKGCSATQQVIVKVCDINGGNNNENNNGQANNGTNNSGSNGSESNTTNSYFDKQTAEEFNKSLNNLKIPNIFTPNGDGKNEVFQIDNLSEFYQNKLQIYSRWGDLIYESNNYQNNWNASNLDPAVYFYQLTVYSPKFTARTLTGWVEVLGDKQIASTKQ